MRRRVRYTPSKPSMILSLVVGVLFIIVGLFVAIPNFGLFGIIWTMIAAGITVANALPLFSDKAEYRSGMIIEEDDPSTAPVNYSNRTREERLAELSDLYEKRLITREDYDRRREEILKEI